MPVRVGPEVRTSPQSRNDSDLRPNSVDTTRLRPLRQWTSSRFGPRDSRSRRASAVDLIEHARHTGRPIKGTFTFSLAPVLLQASGSAFYVHAWTRNSAGT